MNEKNILVLDLRPDLVSKLEELQGVFAELCNFISPVARDHMCWNRVALHHLVYRQLRHRFPRIGSQMVCNAVYSVCRTYRLILENPLSPFCLRAGQSKQIPLVRFTNSSPVYFDRHTLNIKGSRLSMFTMDGRIKFDVLINPDLQNRLGADRVKEILLNRLGPKFFLEFVFCDANDDMAKIHASELPRYLVVIKDPDATLNVDDQFWIDAVHVGGVS